MRLPHVFVGSGLREPILDEVREPPLLDLTGCLLNEQPRHVLQHNRLQLNAARPLAPLDERAAAQVVDRCQYLPLRQRHDEQGQQLLEAERLARNRQRAQHGLLHGGEPIDLLDEQLLDTAENHRTLPEERTDLASEKVDNGLCHGLQGQRVTCVRLDEAPPFLPTTHHLLLREQLLAGDGIQPGEAQRAHGGARALQWHEVGRFLLGGHE